MGARDLQPLLVRRQRKKAADAAAGRTVVWALVPHRLLRDGIAGGLQIGAAAGQGKRARCREIDVIGAVADTVIRPVVARCRANRYPHRSGGLESLVVCGHCLMGPGRFRAAPADRNDRRLVRGVVDCRRDRVEEPGIGIGREIDDDLGAGRDRPGDLDVQHHLAVGSIGRARRMVLSMVDRYGEHLRLGDL